MAKISRRLTPMSSARGRKTGSHLEPERASARITGSTRGKYPKGSEPRPEGTRARSTGSPYSNTMPRDRVSPVATREGSGHGRPAGRRTNPFGVSKGGFGNAAPGNGSGSQPL